MNEFTWKKKIADFLVSIGLISDSFTGKLIINFNQAGVTSIERTEYIR